MNLKNFFIVLVYSLWLVTVFLSLVITLFVGERLEVSISDSTKYYIELTEDEALQVVYVWYLALLGWGWLFLNELRILVISAHASSLAQRIFIKEQKEKTAAKETEKGEAYIQHNKEKLTKTRDKDRSNCMTWFLIPPHSIETCLDILYLLDIKKSPEAYEPLVLPWPDGTLTRKVKDIEMMSVSSHKSSFKRPKGGRKAKNKK